MIFLWIYLSGVVLTFLLSIVFIIRDVRHKIDITLSDLLFLIVITIFSYMGLLLMLFSIVSNNLSKVVIRGSK